jgi:neutral trehalase
METVERCYAETGALWEKYDASIGKVSVTREYDTPEMMGWTAGVYRYLEEELKNV